MKKIFSLIVLLLNCFMIFAQSSVGNYDNVIYAKTDVDTTDNKAALNVFLKNSSLDVKSMQCTIVLPEGASFVSATDGLSFNRSAAVDDNWTVTLRNKVGGPANTAILLVYNTSKSDALIKSGDNQVLSIPLEIADSKNIYELGVVIKDATITGKDLKEYSGDQYALNVYRLRYLVDGNIYQMKDYVAGDAITAVDGPKKEGYTFTEWTGIPSVMPAKDLAVKASFTANSYTLTYVVDGETYSSESVAYGTALTAKDAPVKEGYTFSGWSEVPSTMPAKDVTITGSFTVNKYQLKYVVDGEEYSVDSIAYGTVLTAKDAPTKEGYTFSGWSEIPSTMPAKDITVTGSFTINSYTLTYMVDGEVYATYTVEYGAKITLIDEPVREGETFSGWKGAPETMPAKDVTINGSFGIDIYTITYVVDGKEYASEMYAYGASVTAVAEPTKEGYTFSGWSGVPSTMPAKDVTVTGSFTVNSYTLTYVVDGETYSTESVAYGTALTAKDAPVKEGYAFSGWSGLPSTMPAKDVTVTGSFNVNSYTLTYVVDGETYSSESVAYGSSVTAIAEPTKEGYTFSGWSGVPTTMPAKDVTVSGTFAVNKYQLKYVVDGEEYSVDSIAYGTALTAKDAPVKEGYTFSGWSGLPETMPAKDVTVTGSFTINSYTLTYMVDGEVYATYTVEYGSKITLIDEPVREGETFSGWKGAPETMPARDVTINGSFGTNMYTITYYVDGEVYQSEMYEYGMAVTAIADPIKEGYTFSGWSGVPSTMPAKDVTVTGSFTINSYVITFMIDNEVIAQDSIFYGAEIVVPEAPEKEGYTFDGWVDVPSTMPAHDVTITGSYSVIDGIAVIGDNSSLRVYDLTGKYLGQMTESEVKMLKPGIYIVNNKKRIIK